jgi:hypothetical protein
MKKKETSLWTGLFALVVIAVVIPLYCADLKDNEKAFKEQQIHEKAQNMRNAGMRGTDEELAKAYDEVKKFDQAQQQRR